MGDMPRLPTNGEGPEDRDGKGEARRGYWRSYQGARAARGRIAEETFWRSLHTLVNPWVRRDSCTGCVLRAPARTVTSARFYLHNPISSSPSPFARKRGMSPLFGVFVQAREE